MKAKTWKVSRFAMPNTSMLVAASFAGTLIGCGNIQASDSEPSPEAIDTIIVISYKEVDGCNVPSYVDKPFFETERGKKIRWISDDDTPFTIYFSPFAGDPIKGSNGKTPVQTIPQSAPEDVVYKYTIVADACPEHPLDPFFRVR